MNEAETLFVALRQSADDDVVDMLEHMVRDAPDHALNKINALDLAGQGGHRRGAGHRGASECGGARHFRDDMERHVPKLRRCSLHQ